jgi:hypothetical protein
MEKWKDITIRAIKTFLQGFIAAILVSLESSDLTDITVIKSILIGALAGGISAVMNLFLNLLKKEEENGRITKYF